MTFPESWQPDENFVVNPEFTLDAFLAPDDVNGVRPNITVRCDRTANLTPESFVAVKRQIADSFAAGEVTDAPTTVAGQAATRLQYEQRAGDKLVRKTETHFVARRCGWSIQLTRGVNDSQFDALFDRMLASFEFTNPNGG